MKLGQKSGLLFNTWDENFSISSFKFLDVLNLMNFAIQNSNDTIRAEAFAVVCVSSKTCIIPSIKEFELVQTFLLENVNIDSASLRQEILNSFTSFLIRICDSSLHELKLKERTQSPKQRYKNAKDIFSDSEEIDATRISQNIQFLNWLHHFLISNLEPGTNYQRKILSLQLYMLVLSFFSETAEETKGSCGLRRKEVALKGKTVMKYALQLGKWPFNSVISHKTLLSCVLDPTDDIRETAGLILTTYFSFKEPDSKENKPLLDYALRLCTSPMFYETESGALLMKVLGNWTYKMPPKKSDELICSMVSMEWNKSLIKNRSHSSNLIPHNQQKLLAGLQNEPNRSVHNNVESREGGKLEIKKKVGTFEGMYMMHPSLLKKVSGVELPDESSIFENLAVVARDGSLGQRTTSGSDVPHDLSEKQTYSNTVNRDKQKSLFDQVRSASVVTSPQSSDYTQSILEGQVEQGSWNRLAAKELEADDQVSSISFVLPGRQRFSRKRKKLKNLFKNKQVEVPLSVRSHKFESLIVKHSTRDETRNSLFVNKAEDFIKDSSVWYSGNAYSSALSSSRYESPKFQQSCWFDSSVVTDIDLPPMHARSGRGQHNIRIDCHQKSKEFYVPQSRFCAYKEQNVEADDREWFPNEDWSLSDSPEGKNVHKCETNVGTWKCQHPSKNNPKELGSENVVRTYNGSAPLSVFLLTQAEAQLTSLKRDIFRAASSGSPLHGTITALIRLTTQPDGPECGCMSAEEVNRTVTLLEQTVSFFLDFLAEKSACVAGNPFLYILVSQVIFF